MPVRLSGWTSLIHREGKGVREAATLLSESGVAEKGATAQLPTRQLSWCGSISCKEAPVPSAFVGQGNWFSYSTSATVTLLELFRLSVPLAGNVPLKVSNTGLVAP